MKKITLFSLSIVLTITAAYSQWQYVGSPGFSPDIGGYQNLAIDGTDIYVAYRDKANGVKCTVKKFDGSTWQTVGAVGFSADTADYINLGYFNNTLYVTFKDYGNNKKLTVMKFDGTSWVNVGSAGFSLGQIWQPYLGFYNNEIYVSYADGLSNAGGCSVQKFDGTSWSHVGSPGFSTTPGWRSSLTFVDSVPYVSYFEGSATGFPCSVMKYDYSISNWVYVGNQGFSAGRALRPMITSSNSGQVYVTYIDKSLQEKLQVKTFNGSNWIDVGGPNISPDTAGWGEIVTDNENNLFLAYTDRSLDNKIVMKMFDGSNWTNVGPAGGITTQSARTLDLEMMCSIPVLAFSDENEAFKTSVMMFDSTASTPLTLNLIGNELVSNIEGKHFWINCDNDSIIQIDSSISFQPTENGNYSVVVCTIGYLDTSDCVNYTLSNIIEKNNFNISIYPNPSNGIVNLKYNKENEFNQIRITNTLSQVVYQSKNKNEVSIDLSNLENGVYFLEILNNQNILKQEKIIINK